MSMKTSKNSCNAAGKYPTVLKEWNILKIVCAILYQFVYKACIFPILDHSYTQSRIRLFTNDFKNKQNNMYSGIFDLKPQR